MDVAEEDMPPLEDPDDWTFEEVNFPADYGECTSDELLNDTVLGFGDDEDLASQWFVESSCGTYLIAVEQQQLLN